MPIKSTEAMQKTIAEQQAEILALQDMVAQLQSLLEHQNTRMLARELGMMINDFPGKLKNPIIASINLH